ncbi:hypothetical protein GALMADRAFT_812547 [Galerina marginata CBS 339.88]|uniref:Uncharacterized protein n=1 Tax=Galerina marginata (strain CBS 339.88) TaxID=685588 RepID=A0A067SJ09_GALM3|nr:hypothetical protein GALMADRAFT_812547 [Galerina marginata CBS 339.88]
MKYKLTSFYTLAACTSTPGLRCSTFYIHHHSSFAIAPRLANCLRWVAPPPFCRRDHTSSITAAQHGPITTTTTTIAGSSIRVDVANTAPHLPPQPPWTAISPRRRGQSSHTSTSTTSDIEWISHNHRRLRFHRRYSWRLHHDLRH